tara:strand:- start:8933 stop:10081 length:1149 start_codon:yes stop_codon:yes gene_type:complete
MISKHSYLYATLQSVIGVLASVWLMISFRMSSAIVAAIIFFGIWLFTLGVPGFWFFEFLVPLTASIVLIGAYKCYPKTCRPQGIGLRLFGSFTTQGYISFAIVFTGVIFYLNRLSLNGGSYNLIFSLTYAMCCLFMLILTYAIDHYRQSMDSQNQIHYQRLHDFFTNGLIYVIGAMLVFQVIDNFALGWFTESGYKKLVLSYAATTHKTFHLTQRLLQDAAGYASILYPLQIIMESVFAITLCLRITVLPMMYGVFCLIALLTWVELGVSPTWPPSPGAETNWLWELLFSTLLILIAIIYKQRQLHHRWHWRAFLLDYYHGYYTAMVASRIIINVVILCLIALALKTLLSAHGLVVVLVDTTLALLVLNLIAESIRRYRYQQ